MTTKYSNTWRSNRWWFYSLIVLAVIFSLLLASCNSAFLQGKMYQPPATPLVPKVSLAVVGNNADKTSLRWTGGSECHGYTSKNAPIKAVYDYCQPVSGNHSGNSVAMALTEVIRKIRQTVTATFTPTVTVTVNPSETPSPTSTTTPVVTVTGTPSPTQPVETPTVNPTEKPTNTPDPTSTPKPDKVCNNKNDDKKPGENPTDCNAGSGNG